MHLSERKFQQNSTIGLCRWVD